MQPAPFRQEEFLLVEINNAKVDKSSRKSGGGVQALFLNSGWYSSLRQGLDNPISRHQTYNLQYLRKSCDLNLKYSNCKFQHEPLTHMHTIVFFCSCCSLLKLQHIGTKEQLL